MNGQEYHDSILVFLTLILTFFGVYSVIKEGTLVSFIAAFVCILGALMGACVFHLKKSELNPK